MWLPQDTRQFITWGTDIRLYRTLDCNGGRADEWEVIGTNRYAELIQSITEPRRYIKCVDLNKGYFSMLAIGQTNGKVSLVNLSAKNIDESEYSPRISHSCTSLQWHPYNHTVLAAGFEKLRTEHGVLVWDIKDGRSLAEPLSEAGNGDHCCSLAWITNNSNLIVAGLGVKTVKIFDTRSNMKAVKQTMTKATYGLCVDPWSEYKICGFSELDPSLVIWDTRNFEKPIVTQSKPQQISKVAWCPTRRGLLASSFKDSGSIILHDIMNWAVSHEDGEASVTERSIQPPAYNLGNILDFTWHPSNSNTLLAMGTTTNNNRFCEWTVSDRLTLNWSARHNLVWSVGSKLQKSEGRYDSFTCDIDGDYANNDTVVLEDISVVMQHRAKLGYAGKITISNLKTFCLDPGLLTAWTWILNSRQFFESHSSHSRFQGVRSILDQSNSGSRVRQATWTGLNNNGKSVRTYTSTERDLVLKLCGWKRNSNEILSKASMAEIIRDASVHIFSLDMKSALETLRNGATHMSLNGDINEANQLNMVAVAISGYSGDTTTLWRQVVTTSLNLVPSPTLKSVFAFLAAEDEAYKEVLNVNNLDIVDRIAVAHIFLSDSLLKEFLEREWSNFIANGMLEGILITKNHADTLNIVQAYVDRTGDLQTACWVFLFTFPPELIKSDKVIELVDNYRTMLDRWKMFAERSELDITLTKMDPSWDTVVQIYVACNFCGKNISNTNRNRVNKTGSLSRQQTSQQNRSKAQACPSCRKPMPRCAICLVNMGTMSGLSTHSKTSIVTKFDEWLTWCQTCRHGGHAQHMLHWFSTHTVCPVTGCACKCGALDATS